MQKKLLLVTLLVSSIELAGCVWQQVQQPQPQAQAEPMPAVTPQALMPEQTDAVMEQHSFPVTNNATTSFVAQHMDRIDKEKMSRALDKALNKSTQWSNAGTGITYTVTPTTRILQDGNNFCRSYRLTVKKNDGSQSMFLGQACVSTTDSNWQPVS